jgi:NAD(P)-dependent dehydrogenase (short-subunit alcohol dehydrogenase family)
METQPPLPRFTVPPDLLAERNLVVTGAGDGIGRIAAKAFASHGATTILLGPTPQKLEAVYDEIETAGLPQPALYPINLEGAGPRDYRNLARALQGELGQLHGILHNAAILGSLSPIEVYDVATWYRVMQVNLHAPFLLTRACLPLLRKTEDASILFTTDGVGRRGRAYWGAYGVSKLALEGLMKILADELETEARIRVNAIDPGALPTRLRRQAFPGEDPGRLPAIESVMPAYLYLIGPASKGIHGRIFDL